MSKTKTMKTWGDYSQDELYNMANQATEGSIDWLWVEWLQALKNWDKPREITLKAELTWEQLGYSKELFIWLLKQLEAYKQEDTTGQGRGFLSYLNAKYHNTVQKTNNPKLDKFDKQAEILRAQGYHQGSCIVRDMLLM